MRTYSVGEQVLLKATVITTKDRSNHTMECADERFNPSDTALAAAEPRPEDLVDALIARWKRLVGDLVSFLTDHPEHLDKYHVELAKELDSEIEALGRASTACLRDFDDATAPIRQAAAAAGAPSAAPPPATAAPAQLGAPAAPQVP